MRVEECFAEVNLRQQVPLPIVSCVFAIRWETPTHGTRSRIAHESKNQSIEYADRASSQELVLVSSLLVAIQFPTKHFKKSYEGMILQQASRFAQCKLFVQRDFRMNYSMSNSAWYRPRSASVEFISAERTTGRYQADTQAPTGRSPTEA